MKHYILAIGTAACLALLFFAETAQAQRMIVTRGDGSFRSAPPSAFRSNGVLINSRGQQFISGPGYVDSFTPLRSNYGTNPNGLVTTANPGFVNNATPFRTNVSTSPDGNYYVSPSTGLMTPVSPLSPPMSFTPMVTSVNFRNAAAAEPAEPVKLSVPATVREDEARIKVMVPTADARVWMEERLTKQTGLVRTFASPSLEAGRTYTYRIKASWAENGREVTREKEIAVRAGGEVEVDFREPVPEKVAPPRPGVGSSRSDNM